MKTNHHATILEAATAALGAKLAAGSDVRLDAYGLRSWADKGFPATVVRKAAEALAGQGVAVFDTSSGHLRLIPATRRAGGKKPAATKKGAPGS